MSIEGFRIRKLREQAVNSAIDEFRVLMERLRGYASHQNSCHCREADDESCTCGYTKLLKEIDEF